jgi:hypothetical protein
LLVDCTFYIKIPNRKVVVRGQEAMEEIYIRQPEGYHTGGPNMVFRLRKLLYDLKQAARQWNKKLRIVLKGIGYSMLRSDNSIYIYSKGDINVIVPVFIDDITLVSKSKSAMASAVSELSKHFKLRDLGSTTLLLGICFLTSYHYLPLLEVSVV